MTKSNLLKTIITTLTTIFLLISFMSVIRAVTAVPAAGTYEAGQTINIALTSNPPDANQVGITLNIDATNMTINSYTAPSGDNWSGLTIPCAGDNGFTANEVCISLVKSSGTIDDGDSLGSMNVTFTAEGSATLVNGEDAAYEEDVSGDMTPIVGTSATFTIEAAADDGGDDLPDELPNTAPVDSLISKGGLLILGFSAITLGILVKMLFKTLGLDKLDEEWSVKCYNQRSC